MMKSIVFAVLLLSGLQVHAATKNDDVLNEEVQRELDAIDETILLDDSDEQFLNAQESENIKIESKKTGIVWGQAIEPQKKAQLSDKNSTLKK